MLKRSSISAFWDLFYSLRWDAFCSFITSPSALNTLKVTLEAPVSAGNPLIEEEREYSNVLIQE
jgi:hypothetical protein